MSTPTSSLSFWPFPRAGTAGFNTALYNLLQWRLNECPIYTTPGGVTKPIYYFAQSASQAGVAASDSNDGLDRLGIHFVSGNAVTCAQGGVTLTVTGSANSPLATYVTNGVDRGDILYLTGGTNVVVGPYAVVSVATGTITLATSPCPSGAGSAILSSSGPYKSLCKANNVLYNGGSAFTNGVVCAFKRGDVWQETGTYTIPIGSANATTATLITGNLTINNGTTTATIPNLAQYVSSSQNVPYLTYIPGLSITLSISGASTATTTISAASNSGDTITYTSVTNAAYNQFTFTGPVGLSIWQANTTVTAWGSSAKRRPIFNAFTTMQMGSTHGWTTYAGSQAVGQTTTTTYAGLANGICHIREQYDYTTPYIQAKSIAQVVQYSGSWYYDGSSTLSLHTSYDTSPTITQNYLEYATQNGIGGIQLVQNVDGCRIDNMRVDGYGVSTVDGNSSNLIRTYQGGTNAVVISSCEGYHCTKHTITMESASGAGTGGICTIYQCQTGWENAPESPFVIYNPSGGQDGFFVENTVLGVSVPQGLSTDTGYSLGFVNSNSPYLMHASLTLAAFATTASLPQGSSSFTLSAAPPLGNTPYPGLQINLCSNATTIIGNATLLTWNAATLTGTFYPPSAPSTSATYIAIPYTVDSCILWNNTNVPGVYQHCGIGGTSIAPPWGAPLIPAIGSQVNLGPSNVEAVTITGYDPNLQTYTVSALTSTIGLSNPIVLPFAPTVPPALGSTLYAVNAGGTVLQAFTVSSYNSGTLSVTCTANATGSAIGATLIQQVAGSLTWSGTTANSHTMMQIGSGPWEALNAGTAITAGNQGSFLTTAGAGANGGQTYSPPLSYLTDPANCRQWIVGETFKCRTPSVFDKNLVYAAITAQSGSTVTLATYDGTHFPSGTYQPPVAFQWVQLVGGTNAPEYIEVSSYVSSTGVVTFNTAPVDTARTTMIYGVTQTSQTVSPQITLNNGIMLGCTFDGMIAYGWGNTLALVVSTPADNTMAINCIYNIDTSTSFEPTSPKNVWENGNSGQFGGEWWNCRFNMKIAPGGTYGFDYKMVYSTGNPTWMRLYNCIMSCEHADSDAFSTNWVVGVNNLAANMINNVFMGFSGKSGVNGYDQDPYYQEWGFYPAYGRPPQGATSANSQMVRGLYFLGVDLDGNARSGTSTDYPGPLVATPAIAGSGGGGSGTGIHGVIITTSIGVGS